MTISYKSYLCYALCYLPNISASTFLVIYILLRLKISDMFFFGFFFRFLKICEGGNPEAMICFAVI